MLRCRMQALRKDITRRERQMGTNLDALKVRIEPCNLTPWLQSHEVRWQTRYHGGNYTPMLDMHRGAPVLHCTTVRMCQEKSAAANSDQTESCALHCLHIASMLLVHPRLEASQCESLARHLELVLLRAVKLLPLCAIRQNSDICRGVPDQMELQRLRDWHEKKSSLYSTSVAAWKRFRDAYNKRQKKHEEVRDNVNKELNSQFNRCDHAAASLSMLGVKFNQGRPSTFQIHCMWSKPWKVAECKHGGRACKSSRLLLDQLPPASVTAHKRRVTHLPHVFLSHQHDFADPAPKKSNAQKKKKGQGSSSRIGRGQQELWASAGT